MPMNCTGLTLSFLPACLGGRSEAQWRYVSVRVRDDLTGNFERDPRDPRNDLVIRFTENIQTGEFYKFDHGNDPFNIGMKCFLIGVFSPAYALAMIGADLILALYHTILVAREAFRAGSFVEFCTRFGTGFAEHAVPDLLTVVETPLFWAGVEVGALIGLLFPNDGREIVAKVERAWHRNATYRDDLRHGDESRAPRRRLPDFLNRDVCFLAYCFQPRGTRNQQIEINGQQKSKFVVIDERPI